MFRYEEGNQVRVLSGKHTTEKHVGKTGTIRTIIQDIENDPFPYLVYFENETLGNWYAEKELELIEENKTMFKQDERVILDKIVHDNLIAPEVTQSEIDEAQELVGVTGIVREVTDNIEGDPYPYYVYFEEEDIGGWFCAEELKLCDVAAEQNESNEDAE